MLYSWYSPSIRMYSPSSHSTTFLIHLRSILTNFSPCTPLVNTSVYLNKKLLETPIATANYYVCWSYYFPLTIPNNCNWCFQHAYHWHRDSTIIYSCVVFYSTLYFYAMTYDNSITSLMTLFHQSAPNYWFQWWHNWLHNQACTSVWIYFQGFVAL